MRALLLVLVLAACSRGGAVDQVRATLRGDPPPAVAPDPGPGDTCNARSFRGYQGRTGAVLEGIVFAQPVRIIGPGDAVTEDYSPLRINFDLDATGTIMRIWCG